MKERSICSRRLTIKPIAGILAFTLLALTNVACASQEVADGQPPDSGRAVEEPTVTIEAPIGTAESVIETPSAEINGEDLYLAWTYETGGAINHPPLYVEDQIIVVPSQGPLLALDAQTGALRWTYDPSQRIWDRAYATDGRLLFVGIEGGKLVALDVNTGQQEWTKDLGIDSQVPSLIADGILYVPTTFVGPGLSNDPNGKAKLYALAVTDGRTLWSFESDNYILQTPFLEGDALYVAGVYEDPEPLEEGGHTRLYKLSTADGTIIWFYESEDGFPKRLYATTDSVTFIGYQDFANGIDAASGELKWRRDTGNWVPTLTGAGNAIYFGSANTVIHALDVTDGHVIWQYNIPEGTFNYVLGAPVLVADELLFLTQHGDIMAIDVTAGSLRWRFPTNITSRTGLTVAGNRLFIGDEDGIVYVYTSP